MKKSYLQVSDYLSVFFLVSRNQLYVKVYDYQLIPLYKKLKLNNGKTRVLFRVTRDNVCNV